MAGVRKGRGRELAYHAGYYTSRVYYTSVLGAERKRKARERLRPFHSCGVQKIYQGGTVSCIMTEMLVRCWKRAKRRERIAKLAGKCSFRHAEKKLRTSSGTRVARCKLQRVLYPPPPLPPLQEEDSFRHGFYGLY